MFPMESSLQLANPRICCRAMRNDQNGRSGWWAWRCQISMWMVGFWLQIWRMNTNKMKIQSQGNGISGNAVVKHVWNWYIVWGQFLWCVMKCIVYDGLLLSYRVLHRNHSSLTMTSLTSEMIVRIGEVLPQCLGSLRYFQLENAHYLSRCWEMFGEYPGVIRLLRCGRLWLSRVFWKSWQPRSQKNHATWSN